ncbi:hypothetical protein CN378_17305 [Bacillus sp. AFS015802]|uniref:hypothetical protein n=1 Tax=Bacillus sp. AFS015802 TaxID=2033486 RepID=UPI000BF6CCA9|nr:hypothetical protein [Bacillus sp. AFS015802]PFA62801.1 hypothetical protein CN378_17305 [Bacillus sp. AFS015802]
MKKGAILLICFIGLGVFYYMTIGIKVDYEKIPLQQAPDKIRKAIYEETDLTGFRIFQEGRHTYVYYKSKDTTNDYITTNLEMRWKAGSMVAMARVDHAVSDGLISYDQMIRMKHTSEEDMMFEEQIMSK